MIIDDVRAHSVPAEAMSEMEMASMLLGARVVAVIGASQKTERPAHYVPAYLWQNGYRVIPVNPVRAGDAMWGEPVRASLAEVAEAVDIVNLFRPSEAVAEHVEAILAMRPRPRMVWLQLGIRNDEVARVLSEAGIRVVQDRCILVEHRNLAGRPAAS